MTDDFRAAIEAACSDHESLGAIHSGDWQENGAMRAVGIARADSLRLTDLMIDSYLRGLVTGNCCPTCGTDCEDDGTCPDGHEFDNNSREARRAETMLAIVELCLATGVHLERARWSE